MTNVKKPISQLYFYANQQKIFTQNNISLFYLFNLLFEKHVKNFLLALNVFLMSERLINFADVYSFEYVPEGNENLYFIYNHSNSSLIKHNKYNSFWLNEGSGSSINVVENLIL